MKQRRTQPKSSARAAGVRALRIRVLASQNKLKYAQLGGISESKRLSQRPARRTGCKPRQNSSPRQHAKHGAAKDKKHAPIKTRTLRAILAFMSVGAGVVWPRFSHLRSSRPKPSGKMSLPRCAKGALREQDSGGKRPEIGNAKHEPLVSPRAARWVGTPGHWGVVPSAVCRAVASVWSSCIRLCDRWRSPSGAAVKVAEDGLHVLLSVVKRVLGVETVYAWGARAHDDEESRETVHFLAVGTRADSAGWHVIDAVRATGPWGVRGARVGPGCVVEFFGVCDLGGTATPGAHQKAGAAKEEMMRRTRDPNMA
ncbi:hypothetical protein C8J57DRAFT_1229838 [Mycena rebaudengoi]|nr:hypothetical protein C8J57DRAFT_1229838 [Mycena rebaudengoi]